MKICWHRWIILSFMKVVQLLQICMNRLWLWTRFLSQLHEVKPVITAANCSLHKVEAIRMPNLICCIKFWLRLSSTKETIYILIGYAHVQGYLGTWWFSDPVHQLRRLMFDEKRQYCIRSLSPKQTDKPLHPQCLFGAQNQVKYEYFSNLATPTYVSCHYTIA